MAHTMDALEEWEILQANINHDYFSLDTTNHTSLGEEQQNNTNANAHLYDHYREPEQLRESHPLQPDSEHESSDAEEEVVVSDQEIDPGHDEATKGKKAWPVVWWKSKLDNLLKHFGAVRIRYQPFWCVSVVTAMISFVVLRKMVFGTKYRGRVITTGGKVRVTTRVFKNEFLVATSNDTSFCITFVHPGLYNEFSTSMLFS